MCKTEGEVSGVTSLQRKIGKRVCGLRKELGLTQAQFGRTVRPRLTQARVCMIENGSHKLDVATLLSVADALDTDINYLIGRLAG